MDERVSFHGIDSAKRGTHRNWGSEPGRAQWLSFRCQRVHAPVVSGMFRARQAFVATRFVDSVGYIGIHRRKQRVRRNGRSRRLCDPGQCHVARWSSARRDVLVDNTVVRQRSDLECAPTTAYSWQALQRAATWKQSSPDFDLCQDRPLTTGEAWVQITSTPKPRSDTEGSIARFQTMTLKRLLTASRAGSLHSTSGLSRS